MRSANPSELTAVILAASDALRRLADVAGDSADRASGAGGEPERSDDA